MSTIYGNPILMGRKGTDGTTPHIGENGNWYLGTTDTGKPARGADGYTPVYGLDYGTPEQIAGISNQAAGILQPDVNQIKDDLVRLENLLIQIQDKLNQGTVVDNITVNEINNMIVEYFENKKVSEVEA